MGRRIYRRDDVGVSERISVRTQSDLDAIEQGGLKAFLPSATPLGLIEAAARARPDHCALHYLADIGDPGRNARISYAALVEKIRQAANLFRRLGVGAGDSVAILMPHVPSGQIALWGAEVAGAACPVNPMLRPEHIIGLLKAARAKVAVVLGNNRDMEIWNAVVPALRKSKCVTHILHADADDATPDSDGAFEDLIAGENADRLDFSPSGSPDAIAAYFHTGGTTGAPKLALHTHRNQAFVGRSALAHRAGEPSAPAIPVPLRLPVPDGDELSTQSAFGRVLLDLAKSGEPLADRIVTTAPDVTQTTNLGGFVNARGLFRRSELGDVFRAAKIPSAQRWTSHAAGQHIELGIAENNFFLMLSQLGLAGPHFGTRLIPVGTVYDPFIARGLDALNYACYQDARFLLVGTPSGLTLAAEGGAHQSINPPLIGIGQPGLTYFEPAFADEVALLMRHAFAHIQADDGGAVYLRLSTRSIAQPPRTDAGWEAAAIEGGYWLRRPRGPASAAIVFCGAVAPEVLAAYDLLAEDVPGLGLLNVTSPDLLHRGWVARRAARWTGCPPAEAHVETLLSALAPGAGLVTILDGSPAALSWLGSVRGMRVSPLGVDRFGQTGDLPDLYRTYRLDTDAIVDAAAELFL